MKIIRTVLGDIPADQIGATLTVMKGGEHWFHTDNQMAFLDQWIKKYI